MDNLKDLTERRAGIESRIIKHLRENGLHKLESCHKDINDLCRISAAISVMETESPHGQVIRLFEDALDSYTGKDVMVSGRLAVILEDSPKYVFNKMNLPQIGVTNKAYTTGIYRLDDGTQYNVLVDPNMTWGDNRIMGMRPSMSGMDGYVWRAIGSIPEEIYEKVKQ